MDRLTDEYPTQPQKRVMILKGWQKWLAEAPYAPPTGWYIDIEGGFAVGTGDTTTRLFGSEYVGKLSGVCLNDFRFTRPSDIRKLLSKQAFAADLVNRRTENMAALFSRSDPFGEK